MCSIFIFCDSKNSSLYEAIKAFRHLFEGSLFDSAAQDDCLADISPLLLVHTAQPCHIVAPNPIAVYPKGIFEDNVGIIAPFAALVNSSHAPSDIFALPDSRLGKCQIISCGLSSADTVTFSSYTPEKAVISLQRSIKTVSGRIIEPLDIPINIASDITQFDLLALCALLLIWDRGSVIGQISF